MPINPSTLPEIIQRVRGDFQRYLPNTDIKDNTLIDIMAKTWSGVNLEMGILSANVQQGLFPDRATGTDLEAWASTRGISRKGGEQANGTIVVNGNGLSPTTTIAIGTEFTTQSGNIYKSINNAVIAEHLKTVSLALTDNIVTATIIGSTNEYAVNQTVSMSGADQAAYNGDKIVIEAGDDYFKFQVEGSPPPPTTGNSFFTTAAMALVSIESELSGSDQNLESGSQINFLTLPNLNVNITAYVDRNGIKNGQDLETDEALRQRMIDDMRGSKRVSFTADDVIAIAKENPSVTRAQVLRATPNPGQITVYIASDDNLTSVSLEAVLKDVKDRLLLDAPVVIADLDNSTPDAGDIKIYSVTVKTVDYNFSNIDPSTDTMKQSIITNLKSFFRNNTVIGESISKDIILAAIKNTVDLTSSDSLKTFTLNPDANDLTVADGEVYNLGNVTFEN